MYQYNIIIRGTIYVHTMATSSNNFKASLPRLSDEPHHPERNFIFPKKSLGKSKPVLCSVQSQWFDSWPFLHNDKGQNIIIRWVSDDLTVSEEFLGLYALLAIDAESIVDAMKDTFLHFEIPLTKFHGQCYDGCSTMAGAKAGVVTKITALEPRAVFTHGYGHALNLSIGDTIKHSPAMKDCLETCFEVVKLIKFSPK